MALNKNKESVTENSVVGKQGVTILKKGKRCNGEYLQANSNKTHWEVSVKFKENGKEQRYGWGYKGHSLNRISVVFSLWRKFSFFWKPQGIVVPFKMFYSIN